MGSGISLQSEISLDECRGLTGLRFNSRVYQTYASNVTNLLSLSTLEKLDKMEYDVCLAQMFILPSQPHNAKIQRICEAFRSNNIKTVSDSELALTDPTDASYSSLIETSQVVVIFMTAEYQKSYFALVDGKDSPYKLHYQVVNTLKDGDRILPVLLDAPEPALLDRSPWSGFRVDCVGESEVDDSIAALLSEIRRLIVPLSQWQMLEQEQDEPYPPQMSSDGFATSQNIATPDSALGTELAPTTVMAKAQTAFAEPPPPLPLPPQKSFSGKSTELPGHSDGITAVIVSREGDIFSASDDMSIRHWRQDNNRYQTVNTFSGHTKYVSCLALHTDDLLVSGSGDASLKVWVLSTGRCGGSLSGHTGGIRCAIKSGSNIVSGGEDDMLRVWNVAEDKLVKSIAGAEGYITCLVEIRSHIVAGGEAGLGKIRVYDLVAGSVQQVLVGHADCWVTGLAVTALGHLVSASEDCSLKVWRETAPIGEATVGEFVNTTTVPTPAVVRALAALPDGGLATGGDDGVTRVLYSSNDYSGAICELEGHQDAVTALCVSLNGDIISGSFDTFVRLWH